ncbi:MAG TPA: hemerythrin domain-containing protein, partial [Bacteroidia bacterium]|nr:hemerythrin domain-containing protein [Bacteroidia bacterium]
MENDLKTPQANNNRRAFIARGIGLITSTVIGSSFLLPGCKEEGEKEVSPPEDLMQEHGLLNRILLIYDHCKIELSEKKNCNVGLIHQAAIIIRTFVEDYHEKQEEDYLFPRFEKANQLKDLVATLRIQHQAGRNITDQMLQ